MGTTPFGMRRWINILLAAVVALTLTTIQDSGLVAAEAQTAVAPASNTDIVFSIDGSGSIDATDFDTEKRSIITALQNPELFSVDGSVGVGVVQWAGDRTADEVPFRILSSAADVSAVTAAIDGITQLGGGTNAGDGIRAATDMLVASGRNGSRQTTCLTTDGTNNSGAVSPEDAVTDAKARGVDRLAVASLEDAGAFSESVSRSAYGSVVFDAEVVHSRSPSEFSAVLPSACLRPPVNLVALEPNQGVQNWEASVPLIEGRATVVRAFLEPAASQDHFPVGLRLRGFRDGAELDGSPLVATNPGGLVSLASDVGSRRGRPDSSLNFRLPTGWGSGKVELRLDGAGAKVACHDAARPNADDCATEVNFREASAPELKFVGIPYLSGLSLRAPSEADLVEQADRVYSALPVASLRYRYASLFVPFPGAPSMDLALVRVRANRWLDGCFWFCDTLYYGVIAGDEGGGLAEGIPGKVAAGYIGDDTYARNRGAHEVGHLLGRPHAVRPAVGSTNPEGVCGEFGDIGSEAFPFFTSVAGSERAVLGSLTSAATEPWGVDVRLFPNNPDRSIVDPRRVFELMSYCRGNDGTQGRWPSVHTWSRLVDGFTSAGPASADTAATGAPQDYLLVQGTVDRQSGNASLLPVATVTSAEDPNVPPGDHELVLLDAAGQRLSSVPFAPTQLHADAQRPGGGDTDPTTSTFAVPVVPDPAIAKVEVRKAGSLLAEASASPNAPTLQIETPTAGQTVTGDLEVTWDADDPDGDQLTHTVQYSTDGGVTWSTLSVFQTARRLLVPAGQIPGSEDAALRVITSDGFRSTSKTVGFLHVPNNAPTVKVASPMDGTVFSGAQTVVLAASAADREDGPLEEGQVTWSSSVDGELGTGSQLELPATALAEGKHVITVTATDSAGRTGNDTVNIEVSRVAVPVNTPPAITSAATAGGNPTAGVPASLEVVFTDPDDDQHTLTVDWGDGSVPTSVDPPRGARTAQVAHTWSAAGTYRVTVIIGDGTGSTNLAIDVVVDQPPGGAKVVKLTSSATGCGAARPGELVEVRGNVTGAPAGAQVQVQWRDGSTSTANVTAAGDFQVSHRYQVGGQYRVRATVLGTPLSGRSLSIALVGSNLAGGRLSIVGTGTRDRVVLRRDGGDVVVAASFLPKGGVRYKVKQIKLIMIDLCAGRDQLVVGRRLPPVLYRR